MILSFDKSVYIPYQYKNEMELEEFVKNNFNIVFPEDFIFSGKEKLKSMAGIKTIPDGFAISIRQLRWYIVEFELASHGLYNHIIPQLSHFVRAAKNHETRQKLVESFEETITSDSQVVAIIN